MSGYSGGAADEFIRRYWSDDTDAPKHERLRRAFATAIAHGYWAPGARLPTEAELTEATPCSLGTVQRALRRLVIDGVIERRRGSGTVVADFSRRIEQPWHMRFFDDARNSTEPLPVFTRTLRRHVGTRRGAWSRTLDQQGRSVVRIDRIFSIAGKLRVYSVFYALAERFPALTTAPIEDLDGEDFKLLIARRHVVPVQHVAQSMRIEVPPAAFVAASDLVAGQPATVLNFVAFGLTGEAIYYQDFFIPPSRYRLDLGNAASHDRRTA
ncbi:MAG: GntR family transcriptional regulator [Hyphomicrobiaceae bacterium]